MLGEEGSGRSTVIADQFRRLHATAEVITVDAGAMDTVPRLENLLLLERLDRLDPAGAERLRAILAALHPAQPVAATADGTHLEEAAAWHAVLGFFATSVTAPPLRTRAEDVPAAVRRALAELAPGRRVSLHPRTMQLLCRYTWPGNLRQLRDALAHALRQRPVGELRPEDLPGYCRTAGTRTLTALEVAERDAIVAALEACGGNRRHAADQLGMARSSLYRKLRSYAIVDV